MLLCIDTNVTFFLVLLECIEIGGELTAHKKTGVLLHASNVYYSRAPDHNYVVGVFFVYLKFFGTINVYMTCDQCTLTI